MAAIPFEKIVSSKTFRFLVGPQRREFTVHEAAFTSVSESLKALIEGNMQEAQEQLAVFDFVDEDTFARFCEFAYTGDYTISTVRTPSRLTEKAPFSHKTSSDSLIGSGANDDVRGWAEVSSNPKKRKKGNVFEAPQPSKKDKIWVRFQDLNFTITDPGFIPIQDKDHLDCPDMLLPHAQLYVFADYNLVAELKQLALFRLHATLFANTSASEVGDRTLREVITLYATCHLEDLLDCSEFQEVLLRQNELSRDLIGQVRDRLN
ncbi:BTB/POZ fold protein [Apiospora kogelbergensis]|uniref:BTB/POZ fold protein n=1 Tax=Apiospora kogelbergensis TaxID=1337665 RepID=A0AAW0QKY5_9PEZI